MNIMRFLGILIGLSLWLGKIGAADAPGDPVVFGLTNLWNIQLTISPKAWKEMSAKTTARSQPNQARGFSGVLMDGIFGNNNNGRPSGGYGGRRRDDYNWATCNVQAGGKLWTNVAIRFKGNSSFVRAPNGLKRPFKLDFNRDAPGRTFFGEEELVLNNNVNDATQMREALAYDLFRKAGIAAPRTAFAAVTLTIPGQVEKQFLGLYTIVEPVTHDFLKKNFGTATGLLVKPEMMQGLAYFGDDWAQYEGRYGPKGKVDPAEAKRMVDLARFIQTADPESFAGGLAKFMDPEPFLRFVALNSLLANIDSFIGNGHNYYLFIDARTHKAHFIPWDLNESFGAHPVSGPSVEQMTFSVLRPNADPNMLIERCVGDPRLGPAYRGQLTSLMTNVFEPRLLHAAIDQIAAVTRRVVEGETKRAKADFQRTVLGTLPPGDGDVEQPRHDPEIGRDGYRPWGFPDAVQIDNLPLKTWVTGRYRNAKGQLDGTVRGRRPRARIGN